MKKTFVKALSVMLAALMLLASFTACDGGKEPADTGTEAPTSATVPATDAPTEAPTETETEAPVTDLYVVRDGSSFKISCNIKYCTLSIFHCLSLCNSCLHIISGNTIRAYSERILTLQKIIFRLVFSNKCLNIFIAFKFNIFKRM